MQWKRFKRRTIRRIRKRYSITSRQGPNEHSNLSKKAANRPRNCKKSTIVAATKNFCNALTFTRHWINVCSWKRMSLRNNCKKLRWRQSNLSWRNLQRSLAIREVSRRTQTTWLIGKPPKKSYKNLKNSTIKISLCWTKSLMCTKLGSTIFSSRRHLRSRIVTNRVKPQNKYRICLTGHRKVTLR